MDAVLIAVGILSAVVILVVGVGAYKSRGNKASMLKWLSVGGGALLALIGVLLTLGRARQPVVVKPRERTVAPTKTEVIELDNKSDAVARDAEDLRTRGDALSTRASEIEEKRNDPIDISDVDPDRPDDRAVDFIDGIGG